MSAVFEVFSLKLPAASISSLRAAFFLQVCQLPGCAVQWEDLRARCNIPVVRMAAGSIPVMDIVREASQLLPEANEL